MSSTTHSKKTKYLLPNHRIIPAWSSLTPPECRGIVTEVAFASSLILRVHTTFRHKYNTRCYHARERLCGDCEWLTAKFRQKCVRRIKLSEFCLLVAPVSFRRNICVLMAEAYSSYSYILYLAFRYLGDPFPVSSVCGRLHICTFEDPSPLSFDPLLLYNDEAAQRCAQDEGYKRKTRNINTKLQQRSRVIHSCC